MSYHYDQSPGTDFFVASPVDVIRSEYATHLGRLIPGLIFRQRFWQRSDFYSPLDLNTACPEPGSNAFLVDETPRVSVAGGLIVEWERVWARIPPLVVRWQQFTYPYQTLYQVGTPPVTYLYSQGFTRLAKISHEFILTNSPDQIFLARLPRVAVVNGQVRNYDGWVEVGAGQTVIAADDELDHWMGNIWIRTQTSIRF